MCHRHVLVWGVATLVFHISPKNYYNLSWQYPILANKGIQVKLSNIAEQYRLLCVQIDTKYFLGCVVSQTTKTFVTFSNAKLTIHRWRLWELE